MFSTSIGTKFQSALSYSIHEKNIFYTSLKYIPKSFILFHSIENGVVILISVSNYSLLNMEILLLYSVLYVLAKFFVVLMVRVGGREGCFVDCLRIPIHRMMSVNKDNFIVAFLYGYLSYLFVSRIH
jgi:hypothetical protein